MSSEIRYDLQTRFGNIYGPEEEQAVLDILRRNAPTSDAACLKFEKEFADYCGTKYARVVTNGTAALFLSMVGLKIGPGDRVLTTPLTWIASAAAAATLGAEIDFVDVDPETYNMDAGQLAEKITPNTKAVVPVHLYGQCCDMDAILALANQHGIAVVEDACHAIGAEYKGRKAGSMGAAGCFSFHEQKNMSTLGEGGMIVTNDPDLFERIALYRSHCTRVHGKSAKYCSLDETKFPLGKRFWWQDFDDTGYNFRMTDIQAAVGSAQLKKLDGFNQKRLENALYLNEGLKDVGGIRTPKILPEGKHVFHLYTIQIDAQAYGLSKDDFIYAMLHDHGIRVGTHYIPLHWSTAFQNRGFKRGQFPVAEALAEGLVTLPIHPRLTTEALDYMIQCIKSLKS